MKIKHDFVTNSSSTGFIFIFKGDQRANLFKQLVKYEKHFELSNDYGPGKPITDVWDLITCLDPIISSHRSEPYYLPGPTKIQSLLEQYKTELLNLEKTYNEEKKEKSMWTKYSLDSITQIKQKIEKIEKAIENGLDHCIEISFGDNDGIISGGMMGMTMDYSGRSIKLNEKDFVVLIENQH